MSIPLEQFDFSSLTVPERLDLIERIYDSIEAESKLPPISDDLRAELDRRLNDYLAEPGSVVRWEDVKARFDKRP
jgi:putative addiction module component (TIGR02574 family)